MFEEIILYSTMQACTTKQAYTRGQLKDFSLTKQSNMSEQNKDCTRLDDWTSLY